MGDFHPGVSFDFQVSWDTRAPFTRPPSPDTAVALWHVLCPAPRCLPQCGFFGFPKPIVLLYFRIEICNFVSVFGQPSTAATSLPIFYLL